LYSQLVMLCTFTEWSECRSKFYLQCVLSTVASS